MYFYNNQALTNVGGLSALTSVGTANSPQGGYLRFYYNNALTTLDGLANLTTIGTTASDYLQIDSNAQLTSIKGLTKAANGGTGKLALLTGNLNIYSNGSLTTCQADALKTSLGSGFTHTYNNSGNLACATPKACTALGVCQ
jgi:hypothetical protein